MMHLSLEEGGPQIKWDDEGRATLQDFLCKVANTHLKVKVLELFLGDPYLCLSSARIAERVGENLQQVQDSARELHAADAFLYCESFGYADMCCLSFQSHAPAIQHRLRLLRLALRRDPETVWANLP